MENRYMMEVFPPTKAPTIGDLLMVTNVEDGVDLHWGQASLVSLGYFLDEWQYCDIHEVYYQKWKKVCPVCEKESQ